MNGLSLWKKMQIRCGGFFFLLLITISLSPSLAQQAGEPPKPKEQAAQPTPDHLKSIETALEKSDFEQKRLAYEIENLSVEAQKLRQDLVKTASMIRDAEEKLREAEAERLSVQARENALRQSLIAREKVLAEVLAAMQRIGHKPPPAVLVAPEDALKAIRAAILFGAVLPEMRDEALFLVADLKTLVTLREQAQIITRTLSTERDNITQERVRLSTLIEARQKQLTQSRQWLEGERTKATALSQEAKTLRDLIARAESEIIGAEQASALARIAPTPPANSAQTQAPPQANAMLQPRRAFAEMKGLSPIPVAGRILRGFGAADGFGSTERGVTIEAEKDALVVAPADAQVHFAGPYRGYGSLVILNAGNGYHLVLAGMERLTVEIGQFVLMGEPLGYLGQPTSLLTAHANVKGAEQAVNISSPQSPPIAQKEDKSKNSSNSSLGTNSSHGANSSLGTMQPSLYVEFRKDGAPVDPALWWTRSVSEKARG